MALRYSDEQALAAVRLLALRLWRSPMVKDWRAHGCKPCRCTILKRWRWWDRFLEAAGLPAPSTAPAWGVGRRYWTEARVIAGMKKLRAELGYFPNQPRDYLPLKKGRMDLPRENLIRALAPPLNGQGNRRSAWRNAMIRAGLGDQIESWSNGQWTQDEDTFLLENAGLLTLVRVGFHLGRSPGACRRRLYDHGTRARDARGYYTVQVLAQELNVPPRRVYDAVHSGRLVGQRPNGRPYWQICPDSVEENREWLTRPKKTHTSTPPVTVDWYKQHGLRRNGQGQIVGRRALTA